jgi:hypothetical protein
VALIAVGISHQSSPVTVGEKFWLSELQRFKAFSQWTHVAGVRAALSWPRATERSLFSWPMTPKTSAGAQGEV